MSNNTHYKRLILTTKPLRQVWIGQGNIVNDSPKPSFSGEWRKLTSGVKNGDPE